MVSLEASGCPPTPRLVLCYSGGVRRAAFALIACLASLSCTSESGDPHSNAGTPPVGGKAKRIRDVADPNVAGHAELVKTTQSVSGAIVIAVVTGSTPGMTTARAAMPT